MVGRLEALSKVGFELLSTEIGKEYNQDRLLPLEMGEVNEEYEGGRGNQLTCKIR